MRRSTGVPVLVLLLMSCGGGGGEVTGFSGEPVDEQLDPAWINHIVPGTPEPTYLADPPTSGPHFAELPQTGVLEEPLSRPSQVSVLESGATLFQYRPDDVDGSSLAALERLAGDDVVVAPNEDLPEPVVGTAWPWKVICDGVDPDALRQFADDAAAWLTAPAAGD